MYLRRQGFRRLFVMGTSAFVGELEDAGFSLDDESPDCVVLGFDTSLTYAKLERATLLLRRGVPFIATHPDLVCPTEYGFIPDCGSMIALLRAASGVDPVIVGKPEPALLQMALERLRLPPSRVAMVGDRLYTDMAMARRAGTRAILVLSGETTVDMLRTASDISADLVVADLGALADALAQTLGLQAPSRERS
jgi:HAD superfamily hydrolase (TIGR01450 family)